MDDGLLDRIFAGCLENLPPLGSKIVRIFTSSTFTDMSLERNTLMEEVYPRLKEYCRERHGLEFQVVDMRWGVRDEATDDHMTTELCMNEIKNCQRLSMGPNFVVFLGQKYGYRPIPTFIDGVEFENMREILMQFGSSVALLDLWYKRDSNAVPAVYVLQPISSILSNFNNKRVPKLQAKDQATWWDTLAKLQALLRRASETLFNMHRMDKERRHNYMMSVTEREVINGILSVPNTRSHCLAYIRQIDNVNMSYVRDVAKFIDMCGRNIDTEAQDLLGDLRDNRLPTKIKKPNYIHFTVEWEGKEGLNYEVHKEYLRIFTGHFYKYIKKLVDRAMQRAYLSQQSPVVTEMLQHLHTCRDVVKVFHGRDKELERIKNYIKDDVGQPLIIHGIGGCGKTSLLAKAASLVTTWYPGIKPIVLIRFIGTTPDSSALVPLLSTVCQQIAYNYSLPWEETPEDIMPLVAYLKKLLGYATSEQSLCIFLDSVDQLSGSKASSKVTWIPTVLPPHVKLIVTADSEEDSACFPILVKMIESEKQFLEVKPLGVDLALRVLKNWLGEGHRSLSDYQWQLVKKAIGICNLPIFVKLVNAEVFRWKSYTPQADTSLSTTVVDSIMRFLERIEIQHGKTLVSHAFAYITASKSGVSETELEDLISLDDTVLEDVYQYHLPPVRRIPPLLWTRIRNDLPNYLTEREADGITVMNWYHRQFKDAAGERYLKNMNVVNFFHSSIADYFLGIWGGGNPKPFRYTEIQRVRFGLIAQEGEADRKVPVQPTIFISSDNRKPRYNMRKLSELPYHLVRSKRYKDLYEEILFNYLWIFYKLSSCPLQAVLSDLEDAREHVTEKDVVREITLIADSLRLGSTVIAQYPHMVGPQLVARLLPLKESCRNIKSLIEQCDDLGPQNCALIPAYHCLHTPGGPMKYSLEGHPFAIFGFCVTSDNRYVLSVSNRFIVYDLSTSDVTQDIDPSIEGIMLDVQLSPDDKYAVTFTNYNLVMTVNVLTGDIVKINLDGKQEEGYLCGVAAADGMFVAWSKRDWIIYATSSGKMLANHSLDDTDEVTILSVMVKSVNEFFVTVTSSDDADSLQILRSHIDGSCLPDLEICGGLALNSSLSTAYVVQKCGGKRDIVVFNRTDDKWDCTKTLVKDIEKILSIALDSNEEHILAIFACKFAIWNIETVRQMEFLLPEGVRNISTKPLQSQSSIILTKQNQFAVGGVRKQMYVWNASIGQLLRVIDAHFGRILKLRPLITDEFDGFLSSSIDRSVKVWNIRNIFEQSHVIDRMDMPINGVSMDKASKIAVTVTRSSIGVWSLSSGKLISKLVDLPVGAIITHALITGDSKYIISLETEVFIVWNVSTNEVISRNPHKKVKDLQLMNEKKCILVSLDAEYEATFTVRNIPTGKTAYSIIFPYIIFRTPVINSTGDYIVISSVENNEECLKIHSAKNGSFLFKITWAPEDIRCFSQLVPIPSKTPLVALLEKQNAYIMDLDQKTVLRTISKWHGAYTKTGKYGLFAPPGGGLQVIDLRSGRTMKTLIPAIAEGLFTVKAIFSANDKYVIYYHSGRNTIRLLRMSDGKLIANYKLSSDINAIDSTPDGMSIAVGGVDGTLSVLAIVDPDNSKCKQRLKELPSRSGQTVENVSMSFKKAANYVLQAGRSKFKSGAST